MRNCISWWKLSIIFRSENIGFQFQKILFRNFFLNKRSKLLIKRKIFHKKLKFKLKEISRNFKVSQREKLLSFSRKKRKPKPNLRISRGYLSWLLRLFLLRSQHHRQSTIRVVIVVAVADLSSLLQRVLLLLSRTQSLTDVADQLDRAHILLCRRSSSTAGRLQRLLLCDGRRGRDDAARSRGRARVAVVAARRSVMVLCKKCNNAI